MTGRSSATVRFNKKLEPVKTTHAFWECQRAIITDWFADLGIQDARLANLYSDRLQELRQQGKIDAMRLSVVPGHIPRLVYDRVQQRLAVRLLVDKWGKP